MGFLSRFLSFDKPMGPILVQLLYYLGIAYIVWKAFWAIWNGIGHIPDDWDAALWWIIKTPFKAILAIIALRIIAELARAIFRMDRSLHDQVTGRAAPPASKVD